MGSNGQCIDEGEALALTEEYLHFFGANHKSALPYALDHLQELGYQRIDNVRHAIRTILEDLSLQLQSILIMARHRAGERNHEPLLDPRILELRGKYRRIVRERMQRLCIEPPKNLARVHRHVSIPEIVEAA